MRPSSFQTTSTSPLRSAGWQTVETGRVIPDAGREVVVDVDLVDAGVSKAPHWRFSDCEPSVFAALAQSEMADRKRSGSLSRGVEQAPPLETPQLHGEGFPPRAPPAGC